MAKAPSKLGGNASTTHHSDSYRPRGIADGQAKVHIGSGHIVTVVHLPEDLRRAEHCVYMHCAQY
jgi:hypothetical protein